MSVGAVGGVGGGGGGAAAAGAASGGVGSAGSAGSGGVGSAGSIGSGEGASSVGDSSPGNATKEAEKNGAGGVNITQNMHVSNTNINMSTHDHMCLRDMSQGFQMQQPNQMQDCEFDLKKLIEMMLAIKLLQALNEGQQG